MAGPAEPRQPTQVSDQGDVTSDVGAAESVRRRDPRARTLDAWAARAARWAGRLLPRPTDDALGALTGRSRGGVEELPSFDARNPVELGRQALAAGQHGEALAAFGRGAEWFPKDPWPWHGRADVLQLSGDPGGALEAYEQAIARAPREAICWNGKGNALEGLGRIPEARAAWTRALELDPRLPWPRQGLDRHPEQEGLVDDG